MRVITLYDTRAIMNIAQGATLLNSESIVVVGL